MRILVSLFLVVSFHVHAQETIDLKDCSAQPDIEQTRVNAIKSSWNTAGEASSCVDIARDEYVKCLSEGGAKGTFRDPHCSVADANPDPEVPVKFNYGIYGSATALVNRLVSESNCSRLRDHCIRRAMNELTSLCVEPDASNYRDAMFKHINDSAKCLRERGDQFESVATKLLSSGTGTPSALEASRTQGNSESIKCNSIAGYRRCTFAVVESTVAKASVGEIPATNESAATAPVSTSSSALDSDLAQPISPTPPLAPNTCAGTVLGDGITAITSPTCQVVGSADSAPEITIQSLNSNGQKISTPATCQATSSSNLGEAVQCSLKRTTPSAPLYKLEIDNRVKACRTHGWTLTCPDSAVEAALQRRVKIFGVSGEAPLKNPTEGYAHYSRRTGQVTTASTGRLRSNGVILEIEGRPVMAYSRAPASIAPMADAYAMDKFVLKTSRTPLSEELESAGAPLMREISLGDK